MNPMNPDKSHFKPLFQSKNWELMKTRARSFVVPLVPKNSQKNIVEFLDFYPETILQKTLE
jgi:hypothetical protein